jgi:hypothetical protein
LLATSSLSSKIILHKSYKTIRKIPTKATNKGSKRVRRERETMETETMGI